MDGGSISASLLVSYLSTWLAIVSCLLLSACLRWIILLLVVARLLQGSRGLDVLVQLLFDSHRASRDLFPYHEGGYS